MVNEERRINNFDFAIYDFLCSLGKFDLAKDLADGLMSQKFYSEYNGDNELVAEYLNFFTQSYINSIIKDDYEELIKENPYESIYEKYRNKKSE